MAHKRPLDQAGDGQGNDGQHQKKKKNKSRSSGHSSAPALPTAASHRVKLLVQLCRELHQDPSFAQELTGKAGPDVVQAATALASRVSESRPLQALHSSADSFPLAVFPAIPPGIAYPHPVPNPLPPLPPIADSALAATVFTHRSTISGEAALSSAAVATLSYERLEFLGDAYLELAATRLIYHHFRLDDPRRLSTVRERLLTNATLAAFALAYGFDARVRLPRAALTTLGEDLRKPWTKLLGDVFEAYAAAVVLADPAAGFAAVERWMAALWAPAMRAHAAETPVRDDAKSELSRKVCSRGVRLDYRLEGEPEPFRGGTKYTVGVYLTGWGWDGKHLATGQAPSRQEAGARAAMAALKDPFTAQLGATKRKYDEAVREEREKEGGPDQAELDRLEKAFTQTSKSV